MGPGFESLKVHQEVSVHNAQGPPVLSPNTEVKLCGAENTRREAVREDRTKPTQEPDPKRSGFILSSIAQSVEHLTVNQGVTGSSPVGGAKKKRPCFAWSFLFALLLAPIK